MAADSIKIGAVLPFSGGVELYGRQAKLGLDLAAKEINAGSGILGRPLEVIYEDDQTDPVVAVKATRKLIERDGVLAVVGPITSRNLNAIKPTIERTKTPLLYATNYEGGACSRYVFSFSSVPNQELAQLLPYMNQTFGNTYYMLGADHAWPQKMFEDAQPIILRLGGHILGKEFTTGKETDFAPLIGRIAATKAKVLLFALKGDGLNFIPQAHDLGLLNDTTIAFLGLSETDLPAFGGKGQNMFVVVPFATPTVTPTATPTPVLSCNPVSISGSMEGNLPIAAGSTVSAGYDFTMPGSHADSHVTFTNANVTVNVTCPDNTVQQLAIALPTQTYEDPLNSSAWLPSGDQSSPLVYQGSAVSNVCGTQTGHAPKGATFTAEVCSTNAVDKVHIRFHYSDNSAGGWSGTASVIP